MYLTAFKTEIVLSFGKTNARYNLFEPYNCLK